MRRCDVAALQDNVPPFESAQAIAIVERNLGGPIGAHFDSFEPVPIAAASLGQVRSGTHHPELTVLALNYNALHVDSLH